MRISDLRIRKFRSIHNLNLELHNLSAICGPNSCGKSNLLRAILFAFKHDISRDEIYQNLPSHLRDTAGAPRLSIWVDFTLENCPQAVRKIAGVRGDRPIQYSFRAMRSGTVTRKLGNSSLSQEQFGELSETFQIVYVPPIRDLAVDGMEPFRKVFAEAIRKARGKNTLRSVGKEAQRILKSRASSILCEQTAIARRILGATHVGISADALCLDGLCEEVELTARIGGDDIPLRQFGTGHQSAMILHLYRQLGKATGTDVLYLFEEPDNHLHPSTMLSIAKDLQTLSKDNQVILTTHSPLLLDHVGLNNAIPLVADADRSTVTLDFRLPSVSEKKLAHFLGQFGIRVTAPLLARRTVVVEGPSDATIMRQAIEAKSGCTPDQLDILLIPAGGKAGVKALCSLLNTLGVDWIAVLDWDAALSSIPYTLNNLSPSQSIEGVSAIDVLRPLIDGTQKRGRGLLGGLDDIKTELGNSRPSPTLMQGSVLESLLCETRPLLPGEQTDLIGHLKRARKTKYQAMLSERRIWLWSSAIEEALLANPNAVDTAENLLLSEGILRAPLTQNRTEQIVGVLHNNASQSSLLARLVNTLENNGNLARSEIHKAVDFIVNGLT